MDTRTAARRWAQTWPRAWQELDAEAIVALYHPTAVYSTEPYRQPHRGRVGARAYVGQAFADESEVRAWFGEPLVDGQRAAVPWWATLVESGRQITLAGTSVLRFDRDGLVVDEWDTWNMTDGWREPPAGWGEPW